MTEQSATEQALAAAQAEIDRLRHALDSADQRYTDLFENTGDAIFIIDLATFTVIEANDNAARRLGYTVNELLGMSLEDIEVEDPRADNNLAWESSYSGTRIYECHYRHKTGVLIPVEVSSRVIINGSHDRIQNFVRNIEVRKQMEAERDQLIADLESFAHTVAHDLKNPLANIAGTTKWLDTMWDKFNADKVRKYLKQIMRNSQRSIQIVDALLLLASVRQQADIPIERLDMAAIIERVQERLSPMRQHYNGTLTHPDQWAVGVGYAPWVEEVWINYLSNAFKYGGRPPVVEIGSELVSPAVVRYWVRDNGKGIPAAQLPTLFSKYNRLEALNVEGHGLGLSIAKRIVEKLGGEVGVKSVEGEGSEFSFTLPKTII